MLEISLSSEIAIRTSRIGRFNRSPAMVSGRMFPLNCWASQADAPDFQQKVAENFLRRSPETWRCWGNGLTPSLLRAVAEGNVVSAHSHDPAVINTVFADAVEQETAIGELVLERIARIQIEGKAVEVGRNEAVE